MTKLLSVKNALDQSFKIYLSKWVLIAKLALISVAAFLLIFPFIFLADYFVEKNLFALVLSCILVVAAVVNAVIVSLLVNISFLFIAKERERNFTVKELLSKAWNVGASYAWICFLVVLAVLGGMILLIIPGIIFGVWFIFSEYVFIFEGKKGVEAMRESRKLAQGYWWPIFWRIALMFVVSAVVSSIPNIGDIVNAFVTIPFFIIYTCLIYEDLKRVKSAA